MLKRALTGVVVATSAALMLQGSIAAQRGGGPPRFPTAEQFEASADAQRIVAAVRARVGADLQAEFEMVCSGPGAVRAALRRQAAGLPPIEDYAVEPTKVFDNVWYVGLASQGAFVITTSEGLILIDTLNNTEEARDVIVPGIRKAGLDPAQIKYIVLSHGHPGQTDHTGGANYLQRTYGARVLMSKADWDATLRAQRPERPLADRDIDIVHGQTLTLGDTTLTFAVLFGHSAGSLGMFIPVTWHGESHTVWLHGGGLQHPARASLDRLESTIENFAIAMNAEALLNTHPGIYQDTLADMKTIRENPGGAHPLLYGRQRAARYWSMMADCTSARVVALEQAGRRP